MEESVEQPKEEVPAPVIYDEPVNRVDAFLEGFKDKKTEKMSWDNNVDNRLDRLFGDFSFNPAELAKQKEPEQTSSLKDKPLSWWTKKPKTEKEQKKDEILQDDEAKYVLIQKIRLYFHHFPELAKLHIVPIDKMAIQMLKNT